MRILFSPIGNSDPWREYRDGAMLHIVRHYQPDLVVLYFTTSLWEDSIKQGQVILGHNQYDWENIIQSVQPQAKVEKIIDDSIKDVSDFDAFMNTFHEIIDKYKKKYRNSEMLLNITSGTPQMESTLCLEYITYPEHTKAIQVKTPEKNSNKDKEFSKPDDATVELEIVNEDEVKNDNRCVEPNIYSFRETIVRNQLRHLIQLFDYEAAHQLLRTNLEFRNRKQLLKKLDVLKESIKNHIIIDEIKDSYRQDTVQKIILHYSLADISFRREDFAVLLIRIKSITEFVLAEYLMKTYPGILEMNNGKYKIIDTYDYKISKKYRKLLEDNGMRFDSTYGLITGKYLLQAHGEEDLLTNTIEHIVAVNKLRNNIAHKLEPLTLDHNVRDKIKNAHNALEYLIRKQYYLTKREELNVYVLINKKLEELL